LFRLAAIQHDWSSLRRRLTRRPGDVLIPAMTLAIVIAVGASVFAVVNATMLRPLPFPDQERLVRVFTMSPGATDVRSRNPLASVDFVRFRERTQTLDRLEVIWQRERGLLGAGAPLIVKTGSVSSGFFQLLGGRALFGRTFTAMEEDSGSALAVLGYGLWQRAFGADPSIVGRKLVIDGEPHVVIGVMNADFQPAYRESELWTPLGVNAGNMPMPNATYLVSVGRLVRGRSLADARQEFTQLMSEIGQEAPTRRGWTVGVVTLRDYQFGERRASLLVVLAMVGLLIVVAGTNVASVTLARTIGRASEFTTRTHVGARWSDLCRLVCLEALLVYGLAALGGLLLAAIGLPTILALDPEMTRALGPMPLDWRVHVAACMLALVLGGMSGVWPAVSAFRGLRAQGASGGLRATRSRRARRIQACLIGLQCAVAFTVLIVGASLLDAFWRTASVKPGFDPDGVLTSQVRLSSAYATHEQRIAFMDRLLDSVQRGAGVVAASSVSSPFIAGLTYGTLFEAEYLPTADGQLRRANFRRVAPGYFATLRLPLLRGRDFSSSDRRTSPWVAIISQSLADQVWPHQDPIGHRIRRTEPGTGWMTIIGVVGDVKDVGLNEGPDPTLYLCQEQHLPTGLPIALVVRTQGDALLAAPVIRASMTSLDATQVVDRFLPMTTYLGSSLSADRFRTTLVAVFAATGLLLVIVGLTGLTARSVTERTREMGVRLALGAVPFRLWLTATADALVSVVTGIAFGILVALAGVRVMSGVLVGVSPPSPPLWAAAIALVGAMCAIAAGVAARRVMDIQPSLALRGE
jgi:putative ABC transport system permease protein